MKNSVQINDLSFSYKKLEALSIKDLKVTPNEKVFIHGPSGSGKSTLLNLMAGVLIPTKGSINILEKDSAKLSNAKRDKLRGDHIGFIFQSFNLIPYLTVYENIILPLKASKRRQSKVEEVDAEVNKLLDHLGLTEQIHSGVNKLSIGQQQRVAVARALIGSPEIVIADEPTSSLDDETTDNFMSLLMKEHKGNPFTLIFVSHDKRLAKYFDREISLEEINEATK